VKKVKAAAEAVQNYVAKCTETFDMTFIESSARAFAFA
jgi:hypothetical protein